MPPPRPHVRPHPDGTTLSPRCPQVWAHYEEAPSEEVVAVAEEQERSASYRPVFVTEVTDELHFYVQDVETGGAH